LQTLENLGFDIFCLQPTLESWIHLDTHAADSAKDTYNQFIKELRSNNSDPQIMKSELKLCSRDALDLFVDIYPKIKIVIEYSQT